MLSSTDAILFLLSVIHFVNVLLVQLNDCVVAKVAAVFFQFFYGVPIQQDAIVESDACGDGVRDRISIVITVIFGFNIVIMTRFVAPQSGLIQTLNVLVPWEVSFASVADDAAYSVDGIKQLAADNVLMLCVRIVIPGREVDSGNGNRS